MWQELSIAMKPAGKLREEFTEARERYFTLTKESGGKKSREALIMTSSKTVSQVARSEVQVGHCHCHC